MKNWLGIILMVSAGVASAAESDSWFFRPSIGVGFNSQQGTSLMFGADLGVAFMERWRAGLTGHYAMGEDPERDREYGGGVFAGYSLPLSSVFVAHGREEIGHLDVRNPIDPKPATGPTYESETGVASTTSFGLTTYFTDNLAVTLGYRLVLGLTNSDLGDGRSGPTIGLLIGI